MIEVIFTLDYEIYGNGEGSLRQLILEPAEKLKRIFDEAGVKLVVFVEVAELEMIASTHSDPDIDAVEQQIRDFHRDGHEIGLHIHPQWYNGRFENGKWCLDYSEYNLCTLPRERIVEIATRAIAYLRKVLRDDAFTPVSFRAGNWLFQPTATAAAVLAEKGIKVDSSVFKGGRQRKQGLDYRRAPRNDYYWWFQDDVTCPAPGGGIVEIPIHTRMVPFWKMIRSRRMGLEVQASVTTRTRVCRWNRLLDFCRLTYPLKLDFCRMTSGEFTAQIDRVALQSVDDIRDSRPLVAIGHTKDGVDAHTIRSSLYQLNERSLPVSTLSRAFGKCVCTVPRVAML